MKGKNIFRKIEPYYVAISNMLIGFFIMLTGIHMLPKVVEVSSIGSYAPFFYSLSIVFGYMYFFYYKTLKIIMEEDGSLE